MPTPSACCCRAFSEERHLRRDGVEILGYRTIAPDSPVARRNPDLSGVEYPRMIGAAFFEQERKRTGGLIDIEFRPNDDLRLDLQYFMSELDATNYNRNYLFWGVNVLNDGQGQAPDPGYVVRNNTLVAATFSPRRLRSPVPPDDDTQHPDCRFYGVYDQISRPDEKATSNYAQSRGQLPDSATRSKSPARSAPRRATARHRRRTCPRRTRPANSGAS